METLHRRHVLAGSLAGLVAVYASGSAAAAPADRWLQYHARLQQGLARTRPALVPELAGGLLQENNDFRAASGLAPLIDDPQLALAAQAHLADMQDRDFFAHDTPDGFCAADRVGLLARTVIGGYGENLAFIDTTGSPPTAARFSEEWRGSPGHRANMLRPDYTHVGHAALRFGQKVLAAAVFGVVNSRLDAPLPLQATGGDLSAALPKAHPPIRTYLLSEPAGAPANRPYVAGEGRPRLASGAWRVRPMLPRDAGQFDVFQGPIFFTA